MCQPKIVISNLCKCKITCTCNQNKSFTVWSSFYYTFMYIFYVKLHQINHELVSICAYYICPWWTVNETKISTEAFIFPHFSSQNTSIVIWVAMLKSKSDSSNLFTIKKVCLAKKSSFFGIIKFLFTDYLTIKSDDFTVYTVKVLDNLSLQYILWNQLK